MVGWTIGKDDVSKKEYVESGRRAFLHRHGDTGFKSKWSGIWFPPYKCYEYFAYKVDGTWLDGAQLEPEQKYTLPASGKLRFGGLDVHVFLE